MRVMLFCVLVTTLIVFGCGDHTETPSNHATESQMAQMPDDEAHSGESGAQHDMGINTEITVSNEIRAAWKGVVLEISSPEGAGVRHELLMGVETPLGDSGLVATALDFLPAFEMGEAGITSRTNEPDNPAVRVRITEEEKPDYEGWLFAAMPTIHPFPHEVYAVVLIDGIPAE